MQGYLGAYGALLTTLVQASSSQHIIHKEITTGDHLLSCVSGITAAVYVCTTQAGIGKYSMCPKLGLHRKKLIFAGSTAEVARGIVRVPDLFMTFAMGMFCGSELA